MTRHQKAKERVGRVSNFLSTVKDPFVPSTALTISAKRERARALILEFGWNATAYQLLNPGIQLWFPNAGDGVVG